jgi:hypothetical protein
MMMRQKAEDAEVSFDQSMKERQVMVVKAIDGWFDYSHQRRN